MSTMTPAPSELLLGLAMAAAAGLIGSFAVLRRMTLASDAISHVALPGIGIAFLLHANPLLGALAALLLGTLLVWAIEHKTRIPTEAVIGVVFSSALAIGSMLTSGEGLIDALFGSPERRESSRSWSGSSRRRSSSPSPFARRTVWSSRSSRPISRAPRGSTSRG